MKIDGRTIASEIFNDLKLRVDKLKEKGITPQLTIILVGKNPASVSYVKQKEIKGNKIGVKVGVLNIEINMSTKDLLKITNNLNQNPDIHGIIIQRPLPQAINSEVIDQAIDKDKDMDSFNTHSTFNPPIFSAVLKILEYIYNSNNNSEQDLSEWLKSSKVVVVGKGETGGGPISKELTKLSIGHQIVDSKTPNSSFIIHNSNIVISAVGKPNIVKTTSIKNGAILISIGIHKGKDGKLHGDYNEDKIKNIVSFYTPTPGGVGPINVAMLFKNLVEAAEHQSLSSSESS